VGGREEEREREARRGEREAKQRDSESVAGVDVYCAGRAGQQQHRPVNARQLKKGGRVVWRPVMQNSRRAGSTGKSATALEAPTQRRPGPGAGEQLCRLAPSIGPQR